MADIVGTTGPDTLSGGPEDDVLQGQQGDDVLDGGAGDDRLEGGDGRDTLNGGVGSDTLIGGDDGAGDVFRDMEFRGDDTFVGGSGSDDMAVTRDGGGGSVRMDAAGGADRLKFTSQYDPWGGASYFPPVQAQVTAMGGDGDDVIDIIGQGSNTVSATIDAGEGADTVFVDHAAVVGITLGGGIDTLRLLRANAANPNGVLVTDFQAGDGGDLFDLANYASKVLTNFDPSQNPFSTGHFRLYQAGSDTRIDVDADGGGGNFASVIRLGGVAAASLTRANLGFDPIVSAVPEPRTLNGTDGPDWLTGNNDRDVINGFGGNDQLDGGAGDDVLDGGDGQDSLTGSGGDDRLLGGLGPDTLAGGIGSDVLKGGDGHDSLSDYDAGDDVLQGEAGDDRLQVFRRTSTLESELRLEGGEGADTLSASIEYAFGPKYDHVITLDGGPGDDSLSTSFRFASLLGGDGADILSVLNYGAPAPSTVSVDAGSGDDIVRVSTSAQAAMVTLGAGADYLETFSSDAGLTVLDFEAGAAGDRINIYPTLDSLVGWDPRTSPYSSGHLRVVQVGADARLEADRDAGGGVHEWRALLSFTGVSAASLTAYNLGGYASDGSAPAPRTLTGTAANDYLTGGVGPYTIEGLGGQDFILAGRASSGDTLLGGSGDDQLTGHAGDDLLQGGDGLDRLVDGVSGADVLRGNGGADYLAAYRFAGSSDVLVLDGGEDADTLLFEGRSGTNLVTLSGGAGADHIEAGNGRFDIQGGDGADRIFVRNSSIPTGSSTIDAGAEADRVSVFATQGDYRITLGAGGDTIVVPDSYFFGVPVELLITDFFTGQRGDKLDGLGQAIPYQYEESNPFNTFLVRLVQSGADTLLEVDRDGTGPGAATSLIRFENTVRESFTADNLGFDPGRRVNGTEAGDVTGGGAGPDEMLGFGGDDTLYGLDGRDLLAGGDGRDTLIGDAGRDTAYGGEGDDLLSGGAGADVLFGEAGNDAAYAGEGDDIAIGGLGDDQLYLGAGNDWADAGDRADVLVGEGGFDQLYGGEGRDYLDGGADTDVLFGQGGDDEVRGGESQDFVWGDDGNDVLHGDGGADQTQGGEGDDLLLGGTGFDLMGGGAGNDVAYGGENADYLVGGVGNDLLAGEGGDDQLFGEAGDDVLVGGLAGDVLVGGSGDDTVYAEAGNDVIVGEAGRDVLIAGEGADYLDGGSEGDLLIGGAGKDEVHGGAGNDYLDGGADADALIGEDGADEVHGGDGSDYLAGGEGGDVLAGEGGDDVLVGEGGADYLLGGEGADVFVFAAGSSDPGAVDIVGDFESGVDKLDLRALRTRGPDAVNVQQFDGVAFVSIDRGGDGTVEFTVQVNSVVTEGDYLF